MKTVITIAALLVAAGTRAPASAQGSAIAASRAAPNPKLAGTWEGNYTSDGPSGTMTVTLTKASDWKVTAALGGDAPAPGEARELVIDGDTATWKQTFGEYDVTFKAKLGTDGTSITGTLEATQGGTVAGGGSFTLAKKA